MLPHQTCLRHLWRDATVSRVRTYTLIVQFTSDHDILRICTYSLNRAVGRPRRRMSRSQGRDRTSQPATAQDASQSAVHFTKNTMCSPDTEIQGMREQGAMSPSHLLTLNPAKSIDIPHENDKGPLDNRSNFDYDCEFASNLLAGP